MTNKADYYYYYYYYYFIRTTVQKHIVNNINIDKWTKMYLHEIKQN